MYSVILATMLTTTTATPSWGWGCWGCKGCGCSCSCYGCWGCHGCWGGCHGCWGCSCYGGWGCYGCHGGCYGCYGSCYGCYGGYAHSYGCYACTGCGAVIVKPAVLVPKMEKTSADSAKVEVQMPDDAVLYIDGQRTPLTSTSRVFATPTLAPNQNYYYTLKAEALRDGKVVEETRRVVVRAGSVAQVELRNLEQVVTETTAVAAAARITVRLPEEAKLFVDGQACPLTSTPRSFDTPKLEAGRKFYYTLKAEMVRDGQTMVQSQRVVIEAGKKVDVSLENLTPATTSTASR